MITTVDLDRIDVEESCLFMPIEFLLDAYAKC